MSLAANDTSAAAYARSTGGPRVSSRLWERDFWIVQAGVLLVTLVHVVIEVVGDRDDHLTVELGSLAAMAYLIPVIYAGIRFGMEGGLFTGLLAAVLSVPNLVFLHHGAFGWLGELATVLAIIAVGIAVGLVVERERQARSEAEATSGRLGLLNRVSAALTRHGEADRLVTDVLHELAAGLDLAAAGFYPTDAAPWSVESTGGAGPAAVTVDASVGDEAAESVRMPVRLDGRDFGILVATTRTGDRLGDADEQLLHAVVREMGVALENVRLRAAERKGLQDYVLAVTAAQEDERKRIARDLHDDAAQSLVLLSRGLGRLASDDDLPESHAAEAEHLREMVHGTLESVRRASRDLRPAVLDDLGLAPALEWLVGRMSERETVAAEFSVQGARQRLQPDQEVAAFRIAQEALRNVEKHSGADAVTVTLYFGERSLELEVFDNGRGFDPNTETGPAKLGLLGMRERAELVAGRLDIDSRPGHGTTVTFELTLADPKESQAARA